MGISSVTHQHASSIGRLEAAPGVLAHQLGDGQPVVLADVVDQAEGVVLHHDVVTGGRFLGLIDPALDHVRALGQQVLRGQRSNLRLTHSASDAVIVKAKALVLFLSSQFVAPMCLGKLLVRGFHRLMRSGWQ